MTALATLILLAATIIPLWRHPHWIVRAADFPRQQVAVFAVFLLAVQLVFLDRASPYTWLEIGLVALCLASQLWWIAPFTRLWRSESETATHCPAARQLSIITANVLKPNRNAQGLLALVAKHKPDVLLTLESDNWWQEQLSSLERDMPHTIKCPLDNLYGMHVYSRLPLEDPTIEYLVEDDIPSMHARLRMPCGDAVRVHFLHPAPPSPTENTESTERDAELVIVARSISDTDEPTIVTGDLNDVAWSSTTRLFRKLSGLLDPRVGRGVFNTFHAAYPFARWPLDHLFHSRHFGILAIQRLPPFGSDHFALLTRLAYSATQRSNEGGLEAEDADHSRARSIASRKNVSKADVPNPGE